MTGADPSYASGVLGAAALLAEAGLDLVKFNIQLFKHRHPTRRDMGFPTLPDVPVNFYQFGIWPKVSQGHGTKEFPVRQRCVYRLLLSQVGLGLPASHDIS